MEENQEKELFTDEVKNIYWEMKLRESKVAKEWFKKRLWLMIFLFINQTCTFVAYTLSEQKWLLFFWVFYIFNSTIIMFWERNAYISAHMFHIPKE